MGDRRVVSLSLPEALYRTVERERGDVSRSKFIQRALEKALRAVEEPVAPSSDQRTAGVVPAAPSRAPKVPSKVEKAPVSVQRPGSSEPLERLKDTGLLRPASSVGPRRPRSGPIEKGR